jgi:hypothetical protein
MGNQAEVVAKTYHRRRGTAKHQAVHVSQAPLQDIAEWCGGSVVKWNGRDAVRLATGRTGGKVSYALPSDVIVHHADGTWAVYNGWHFSDWFVEASHE